MFNFNSQPKTFSTTGANGFTCLYCTAFAGEHKGAFIIEAGRGSPQKPKSELENFYRDKPKPRIKKPPF